LRGFVVQEAQNIAEEDVAINTAMAKHGAALIDDGDTVLTHCNAGALATVDVGTALGVIIQAHKQGKKIHVMVDETRPRLQGAKLTAWELTQAGVPMTLIADNAAGHYLRKGIVKKCFVGSDRVAANGDVANKIGTHNLAIIARHCGAKFMVAAPHSSFDLTLASGAAIPIEQRHAREITHLHGDAFAPHGCDAINPAFDVTPAKLIDAIVTEHGLIERPNRKRIAQHFSTHPSHGKPN